MRIGLNLLYLLPRVVGGTETYASGLLDGLNRIRPSHDIILFVNLESANWHGAELMSSEKVVCPVKGVKRFNRYLFEQVRLPRLLRRFRIDVVHSLGYTSPIVAPCPSVVTIHDLNFKAFGNSMPLARRAALAFFVKRAIRHSSQVITVSHFSRQEIMKYYKVPPGKVVVIPEAPALEITRPRSIHEQIPKALTSEILGPYFLAFNSASPNKNIANLVKAYRQLRRERRIHHRLVLVGTGLPFPQEDVNFSSADDGVIQTGYLKSNELSAVLKGADFLAFPSYYEGFGLPILEAMSVGVPVVCSYKASLPEVAGDAALFFDPFSVDDIASKLSQVSSSSSLRNELKRKGYANARGFSWEATALRTLEIYERLASQAHQTN